MKILWGGHRYSCGHVYNPPENGDEHPVIVKFFEFKCPNCDPEEFHLQFMAEVFAQGIDPYSVEDFIRAGELSYARRCL